MVVTPIGVREISVWALKGLQSRISPDTQPGAERFGHTVSIDAVGTGVLLGTGRHGKLATQVGAVLLGVGEVEESGVRRDMPAAASAKCEPFGTHARVGRVACNDTDRRS